MTIANINNLPFVSVRFTGRDLTVSKVVLINKETNQELISTNQSDWSVSGGLIAFNLFNYPDFLDDIKESTSISFLMYDSNDKPIYKDLVRFFSIMNTDSNYAQNEGNTEYIFLDNE